MGLGDELMCAGRARVLRAADPRRRKVRIFGVDGKPRTWQDVWSGNPDIAAPGESGDFITLVDGPNARPYIAGKTAQRWHWKPYKPQPALIRFSEEEIAFGARHAGLVIVEPNVKAVDGRSNKNWGWARWNEFAHLARAEGIRITQLGPVGTPVLAASDLIITPSFRLACAVLAGARAGVLTEGGLHHAAAALGVPAVVIFGGFISPAQTGYATHRNLFTGGQPCGMRVPCNHCAVAMLAITPEMVINELRGIL